MTPFMVQPSDSAAAKALALAAPACDSTAAALRRRYREPEITRAIGYLDLGDGIQRPACTLSTVVHTGVKGAPPLPLTRGPSETGWIRDDRFMADGVDGETYGFRGYGAVCSVSAGWVDPGDLPDSDMARQESSDELTLDISCARDPAGRETPAVDPGPGADIPWSGAEPLNIENKYRCYWYADRTVVVVPIDAAAQGGVPGEDIIVRGGRHAPCGRDSLPGDFIVRAGFFNRFRGIIDSTLVVEDGDAATYSGLHLYSLGSKALVADLNVAGMIGGFGKGSLGVWMKDTTAPARIPCPPGDGIRVQRLVIVTLATGALTPEGSTRCRFEE